MRKVWLTCISLLLAIAANASEPQWLVDARAREGKLGRQRQLESPDGLLRARVPAKLAAPITLADGDYAVNFDIGATSPMECLVRDDSADLAGFLLEVEKPTFELIASVQGKVETRGVERIDAGAIGANPYLAIEWIYRANPGAAPVFGGVKQLVADKHGHAIYCVHIDLGYRETFRKAAHALVESLEFGEAPEKPSYAEVAVVSTNGMRIGVATNTLVRDAEGNTQSEQRTSMLVPAGPETLQSSDGIHIYWMRPDATLIRSLYVEASNGKLESQLELQLGDDGAWHVEGKFKGKPLSATWPGTETPSTWLEEALALRKRLGEENAEGASISLMQWIASADPTKLSETKTTIGKAVGASGVAAHQSGAGLEMDAVLDKSSGMPISITVPVGPSSITVERVFVDGNL